MLLNYNNMRTFIYGLFSTRNNEIRYVGKANDPKERLRHHLYGSNDKINNMTHKCCWIRKELNDGYKVDYIILEECEFTDWEERECHWINRYDNLTNTSKGGKGGGSLEFLMGYVELCMWRDNNLPPNIKTASGWKKYIKENNISSIPLNPNKVFKNSGWLSWCSFLDSKFLHPSKYKNLFISLEGFKKWLNENNIKNSVEFNTFSNKPDFIPTHPDRFYKNNGWINWNNILPLAMVTKPNYLPYEECKLYLKNNFTIKSSMDFRLLCKEQKIPNFIPKKPERVFQDFSFGDFLSTGNISNSNKNFITFEEAKNIIIKHGLKTNKEWRKFIKINKSLKIPTTPDSFYKTNGWISWGDFLGTGNIANKNKK